jgi:hypothetical protein
VTRDDKINSAARQLRMILAERTSDNPVSVDELQAALDSYWTPNAYLSKGHFLHERDIRRVIEERVIDLLSESKLYLVSAASGYWCARDRFDVPELEKAAASERKHIESRQSKLMILTNAIEKLKRRQLPTYEAADLPLFKEAR